jgi:hypothetical protein
MRRKTLFLGSLLAQLAFLTACAPQPPEIIDTLDDIVYRNETQDPEEYKIYIQEHEDGPYEPYLVLEGDYDGGVLLLRYFLLDETMEYRRKGVSKPDKTPGVGISYYPDSDIDDYLCDTFLPSLAPDLQERVLETSILVADVENYTKNGEGGKIRERTVEAIQSKIFLLSATEMNVRVGLIAGLEGEYLRYFERQNNYSATFRDGKVESYWLRSAVLGQNDGAWYIGQALLNGRWFAGGGPEMGPHVHYALRPAFCLAPDTAITRAEVDGAERYVLGK